MESDSSSVELVSPVLKGDSLGGRTIDLRQRLEEMKIVAVPLNRVAGL